MDSYSYFPQFQVMNIIPIREYSNLTNNISIHKYFFKVFMNILFLIKNIYREWAYISLWFSLPGKFFNEKIYKSQEKEIIKEIYERKYFSGFCE